MKMKKYYSVLKARAEHWFSDVNHRQQWAEYVTQVVKEGGVQRLVHLSRMGYGKSFHHSTGTF